MLGKTILILVLIAMVGVPVSAGTWDYAADYSTTANPSGAWTYGCFNPDGVFEQSPWCFVAAGVFSFWTAEDYINPSPGLVVNAPLEYPEAPGSYEGAYFGIGGIMGSPNNASKPVVRWTAPTDCIVQIDAMFTGGLYTSTGSNSLVWVLLNGNTLMADNVVGFAGSPTQAATAIEHTATYSNAVAVTAGSFIDFVVGDPGDRVFPNDPSLRDWLQFNASITTVPEPSSLLPLISGLGCLAAIVRRRRP